jgi:hypothetical protein
MESDSLRSRVGGRLSYDFHEGGIIFTPPLSASWKPKPWRHQSVRWHWRWFIRCEYTQTKSRFRSGRSRSRRADQQDLDPLRRLQCPSRSVQLLRPIGAGGSEDWILIKDDLETDMKISGPV